MSATSSNQQGHAAALIADAILAAAAAWRTDRRLYLAGYLGVTPDAIHRALAARADGQTEVELPDGSRRAFDTISAGGASVLPYLVTEPANAGGNRGSQGFAAYLRAAPWDPGHQRCRVVVVLDQDPVETIRTAADDASLLPATGWRELCRRAAGISSAGLRPFLEAVCADYARRTPESGDAIERLARFCAEPWADRRAAATQLHQLGCYLSDPPAADRIDRLASGAAWRETLDRWMLPGEDLRRQLARKLGPESRGTQAVLAALRPLGLDFASFVLDDLDTKPTPPAHLRLQRPLHVEGAAAHAAGNSLAVRPTAGDTFVLRLTGEPAGDEQARLEPASAGSAAISDDGRTLIIQLASPGWTLADLYLRAGSREQSLSLAAYRGPGSWFPIDRHLAIDAQAGAFVCEGDPEILAIGAGGKVLGPAALDLGSHHEDGKVTKARATFSGETVPVPLLLAGRAVADPEPEHPEPRPQTPPEPPAPPQTGNGQPEPPPDRTAPGDSLDPGPAPPAPAPDPGSPEPPAPRRDGGEVPSAVHAMLAAGRDGGQARTPTFSSASGQSHVNLSGTHYTIGPDRIAGWTGPELEAAILAQPQAWAHILPARRGETGPQPARELERLSLQHLDTGLVSDFSTARADLFSALAPHGSVHAIGAGLATREAEAYCAAYAALIKSIIPSDRYQPEYDRLLLVDAIFDYRTGDVLIAPTNPVSVAFLLCFHSAAGRWLRDGAIPGEADIAAISPRHLLPMFYYDGRWHESIPDQPFGWRRYRPLITAGTRAEHDPAFIASRLAFFLDVDPAYRDPRQRIAAAFHDPGDGQAVADALIRFYEADAAPDREQLTLPALDIYLVGTGGTIPPAIDAMLTTAPEDSTARQLTRSRVRIAVVPPDHDQPFCHLSFVFRSPAERTPWPVGLDDRAPTTFVGGLATSPGRATLPNANELAFAWGTFGTAMAGSAADHATTALLTSCAVPCLELVGGQPREAVAPGRTRMPTTRVEPGFLPSIYARSTWVVHLDRLLGLDAFSPGTGSGPQRYLIDYEEGADPTQPGLDSITATERVEPYLDAISRALRDLNPTPDAARGRILHLLNAVSGKWALQLLRRSAEQVRERIGTVAAIAALQELDNSFGRPGTTGVLVPLDELLAQLETVGAAKRQAPTCDDLLFLHVPHAPGPAAVRARLIEVKYRTSGMPDLGEARKQLDSMTACLTAAFDPANPAALFRSRDLAEIIRVAASRGATFGLAAAASPGIEPALAAIAAGNYRIDFGFWIGQEHLAGDVISIEAASTVAATRTHLPGDGMPYGLVRLGRPTLQNLATGKPLAAPAGWQLPAFDPPPGRPSSPPAPPTPPPAPQAPGGGSVGDTPDLAASRDAPPRATTGTPDPAGAQQRAAEARTLAAALDAAALKYGLELEAFDPGLVQVGPSVVRLRTRPLGKQSLAGVQRRALDLGREIGVAEGVIVDQEPYYLTVDVARTTRDTVTYTEHAHLLDDPQPPGSLPFLVGMAPSGETRIADLARLPHLLVAGATGSGKSVLLRGLVCSLIRNRSHEQFRILIVDPKQVDFLPFEDLPHLAYGGIVTDPHEAITVLQDMIETEISTRRPKLKEAGVTSVLEYYEAGGRIEDIPQTVVLVDEFADLAASLNPEDRGAFFQIIQRYGQVTRAFGIYLVLATQRPSVQVINGDIKANLTARIALKVQASQDSVTILGRGGAERLRDQGDMLFDHGGRTERLQGLYASPADAREAVKRASRQ